jgi:hypothetical protein
MEMCWLVATMTDLWESDQAPALFSAVATKQIMTKPTTIETSPQSKNCYSPIYKRRASQPGVEAQTRRAELRR